jgi:broad specificity phosphatase PhoE
MSPTSGRRRIYLMRHGSVTYFDANGHPYAPDAVPLDALGRQQAAAAGREFANAGIEFDRVIISGLPRTVETASIVLQQTEQLIEMQAWAALQEFHGGKLEEIADEDLKEAFTGAFRGVVPEHKQFLGGETVGDFMDRVHPEIDRLRADASWDTVLMVLHGGVNRAILSYAMTGQRMFFGSLSQRAGCINVLDVGEEANDWVLRVINHSPMSALQDEHRSTAMEMYLAEYSKSRVKT